MSKLTRTAYHEAGHALAAFELGIPVRAVSVKSDERSWGHVLHYPSKLTDVMTMSLRTRDRLERRVIVGLAGREGEYVITGRYSHRGAREDYRGALNLVLYMVGSDDEAQLYLRWLEARARNLVRTPHRRPMLDALAGALLERKEMSGKDAFNIYLSAAREQRGRLQATLGEKGGA